MLKFRKILEAIKEDVLIIFCAAFFLTFIISQNGIPSDSMETTVSIGDRLIITMLPYYHRSPLRGEIVIFNGPDGKKWIKRVIGLPGETVDIVDGNVYIDGEKLDESAYLNMEGNSGLDPRYEAVSFPYTVPKNAYFLMGDNRLASEDCRYIGAIDEHEITGKAWIRIFPFNRMGLLNQPKS